jgi:hypothetical protein
MITDFCNELNRYLQDNYSLKRPPAHCNIKTVDARRSKFDLYFRYKPLDENQLVIARIGFKEQKKGHGTKLLKFLSEIIQSHGIESIILECVNENSYNFGIKMGFTDIGNSKMMISSRDLIEKFGK